MKCYQVITNEKPVLPILNELRNTLSFDLNDDGSKVWIEKSGHGIHVKKSDGQINITYEKQHEIARAWFLMLRMDEKNSYDEQETCVFDQLQVMLDCSRNAVMNIDTLKIYIQQLAALGYHSLQLYTEDTLCIEKEPYVGYMRGAYSKEEIKTIDAYCNVFGMELIPCIQTLAHINQIVRYDRYKKIVDVNDILLADNEKTYEFLEHLIESVADCFTSRKINIGMDEAHMLGLGKHLDQFGYQDRFQIMIRHLTKVMEILRQHGFEPMMWSDMFFRLLSQGEYQISEEQFNADLIKLIPQDVTLVYWDYYSMDYQHYFNNLSMHHRLSDKLGFAAGAWKWTGFAPENGFSLRTGQQALNACIDAGIKEFMITCWGDNGAEASAFSVLPCLYQYAEAAYHKTPMLIQNDNASKELNHNFEVFSGLTFDDYMMIDSPNQIFATKDHAHSNACKYLLYNDVLFGTFDSVMLPNVSSVYEVRARQLKMIANKNTRYSYLFESLSDLCQVLSIKAALGLHIYQAYQEGNKEALLHIASSTIPELVELINQFIKTFRYQWHKENKSFGFEIQLIRLGGLKERLLYTKEQITNWLEGGIGAIEELEGERLPFAYFDEEDSSKVNYNLWNVIVSPAVMG